MKRIIILLSVLFGMTFISCGTKDKVEEDAVKPADNSAKIVFIIGDVKIESVTATVKALMDMPLSPGSSIVTGAKSQCNLLIGKDSYISVRENSKLQLDSLVKSVDGLESSSVELKVGKLVVNPKKLMKDESFSVKTPTAVAAVRGTKFVVESETGKQVRVAVVEGKVEMTPRVALLETQAAGDVEETVFEQLQKTVDEQTVIIEANQSATMNTESTEALNKQVESVVQEVKSNPEMADSIKKAIESKSDAESIAVIENITQNIQSMEVEKIDSVDKTVVEDVKDLDVKIEAVKVRQEEQKTKGTLVINLPVETGIVYIDGKRVGRGNVVVSVDGGKVVSLKIEAKGFTTYTEEVSVEAGESKTVEIPLVRSKLLDRIGWSAALSGTARGDMVFYGSSVITTTSSGAVVSMTKQGVVQWRAQLNGGFDSAPAVADGCVYVVTKKETVYGLSVDSGKVLWSGKIDGSVVFGSSPRVVDDNIIIATSSGNIYSFNKNGSETWKTDISTGVYSSPTIAKDYAYVGGDNQTLYKISLDDGSIEWKSRLEGRFVSAAPVISGDSIYIGTFKGMFYSLTVKRGKINWKVKTSGAIVSSAVVVKGKVLVGTKDGSLYAFNNSDGTQSWMFKAGAPITAEVAYNGSGLYLLAGGTVYALNPESGNQDWSFPLGSSAVSIIADSNMLYVSSGGSVSSVRIDLRDVVR